MSLPSQSSTASNPGNLDSWAILLPEREPLRRDADSVQIWKERKYQAAVEVFSEALQMDPAGIDARRNYRELLSELRTRVTRLESQGPGADAGAFETVCEVARRFFTALDHGEHHMAWMRCLVEEQMAGPLGEVMGDWRRGLEAKKGGVHGARRLDVASANLHGAIAVRFDPTHHTNLPYPLAALLDAEGQEVTRVIRMGCPVMPIEGDDTQYMVTPEFSAHIRACESRGEVHLYCNHLPAPSLEELKTLREARELPAAAAADCSESEEVDEQPAAAAASPSLFTRLVRGVKEGVAALTPNLVAQGAVTATGYAVGLTRRAQLSERAIERACYTKALERFSLEHREGFKLLHLSPDLPELKNPEGSPHEALSHLLQTLLIQNRVLDDTLRDPALLQALVTRAQVLAETFFPTESWPAGVKRETSFAPMALLFMALFKDAVRATLNPRWCNSTCKDGIDRGGVFNALDLLLLMTRSGDFEDPSQRAHWLASLHAGAWEVKKQAILANRHEPLEVLISHLEAMPLEQRQALLAPLQPGIVRSAAFVRGSAPAEAEGWREARELVVEVEPLDRTTDSDIEVDDSESPSSGASSSDQPLLSPGGSGMSLSDLVE